MTKGLCGFPTLYHKIIEHYGITMMLDYGAFDKSLNSGKKIELLLNHQPELVVGSTRDILQLLSNSVGLAMRAWLPDSEHGKTARWMGENGHDDSSIGFDYHAAKKRVRRINGVDVTVIVEADLYEVSYLFGEGLGAVKNSFLTYKVCDFRKPLSQEAKSFVYDGAAVGFRRALNKLYKTSLQ